MTEQEFWDALALLRNRRCASSNQEASRMKADLFLREIPDIVTAEQWAELYESDRATPEMALALSVLETAVADLRSAPKRNSVHKGLRDTARDFVASTDTEYLFSFENICSIFDLDAASLRRRLLCNDQRSKTSVPASASRSESKINSNSLRQSARPRLRQSRQSSILSAGTSLAWSETRQRRAADGVFARLLPSFGKSNVLRKHGRTSSLRRN